MTLQERRRRYDLIEMFKVMNGIYKVDKEKLFEINTNSTRGHALKLQKKYSRVIDDWNHLPAPAIEAKTVLNFKKVIDPLFYGGFYMIQ